MPNLPKPRRRPWQPPRQNNAPQTGRKVKNPFYQTMPWRKFRAGQKEIAIEQSRKIMEEIIKEGKPLPPAFEKLQPLCAECLKGTPFIKKKYTAARVLDHIKPINPKDAYNTAGGRFGEPLSPDNVQWLCDTHHAKKSGAEHLFHSKR